MMNRKQNLFWIVLVLGGVAGLVFQGPAQAAQEIPEPTVGYICVAGLAVELARTKSHPGAGDGIDWPGVLAFERCRLPLMPAGLPGQHLMSSMTKDRRGGVTVSHHEAGQMEALEDSIVQLGAQGWSEEPGAKLARDRSTDMNLTVMEKRGARIYVSAAGSPTEGGSLVVAAGLFSAKEGIER